MSIGVPELVILLIVALGIGVTAFVVVIIATVVVRQRGGRFTASHEDTDPPPDAQG